MSKAVRQLELFNKKSLNPSYEMKRQIRLALADSSLSRDEIVDRMNGLASREGMKRTVSKATLDSWTKDSDPNRVPSSAWVPILCEVLGSFGPLVALCESLGCRVIGKKEVMRLEWADAEILRRQAARRAKVALDILEI